MVKVLLVVDLQLSFKLEPYYSRILDYISRHRSDYDIVVATRFQNTEASPFVRYCNYTEVIALEQLEFKNDMVIDKSTYGIGERWCKYFDRLLAEVTVIGCDTDACVLETCFQLFDNNIKFKVLTDYCYSTGGQDCHEAGVKIMKRNFGKAVL